MAELLLAAITLLLLDQRARHTDWRDLRIRARQPWRRLKRLVRIR